MAEESGDILVIQVGSAEAKVYTDITDEKCLSILAEQAPDMASALRRTNARLSAIRNEVLAQPDKVVEYYLVQAAQARTDEAVNLELENLSEANQASRIDE